LLQYYPLTHPQKRVWYTEKIYPCTSLYNIGGSVRIKGPVDFDILSKAINIFIKTNQGLLLKFTEQNGEIQQYLSDYIPIKHEVIDFSQNPEPVVAFEEWIDREAKVPFNLEDEFLFYFALFKIDQNDNGYLAKYHHLICDGWSFNIMTEQICENYTKLAQGGFIDDTPQKSYLAYLEREREYLSSSRFLIDKQFWQEQFKTIPELSLTKGLDSIASKRKTFTLETQLSMQIKQFVTVNKCSLNTFFITVFLLYLYKSTFLEDLVIGTPVFNRSGKKEKDIFGMFTSSMPFRFKINDRDGVGKLIADVNEKLKKYYFHQKYPYDNIVEDLELSKRGYNNLFNLCVNYYNIKPNLLLNEMPIENAEFHNGCQVYSLELVIKDWLESGCLILDLCYKEKDYSPEQIDAMYVHIISLVKQIINNPDRNVGELCLLDEQERERLLNQYNGTAAEYPRDKMIYELFEEQVVRTPDKIAVSFKEKEITYRELNNKANQLAKYLSSRLGGEESFIGLFTTHSIETIIGILGILKAGKAYLPIDPYYPPERMNFILEDSGIKTILANIEIPKNAHFTGKLVNLDEQSLYSGDVSNLGMLNNSDSLVYLIYTSGSTGVPKGTAIKHRGLVNYIWWARKMYIDNDDDIFPLYSSLSFDLTVTSIFTPLISGNKIMVYSNNEEEHEYALYRIMKENKATIIKLTPSHLTLLKDLDNRNSSVKRLIVGGEDLRTALAKEVYDSFGGDIEIFNEYGPTETVVGCMLHKYDPEADLRVSVPIGVPAANVQVYILDRNLNPVPINTIGEMYVAGDGVVRGYLHRPQLTRERFINNPFRYGSRMYKTGDLARFLDNGTIEFVGRADRLVKVHGYRIELGEIENILLCHPAVKNAIVLDFGEQTDKYLCAYIVPRDEIAIDELNNYLQKYLPSYMVPLHFLFLDEVPFTINGKVNTEALPRPEREVVEDHGLEVYGNGKKEALIDSMCQVLSQKGISTRHDFYRLGGDSIKAIQVAARLHEKGFKLKVQDILANPVIEVMAQYIEPFQILNEQGICEGDIEPGPIVFWFFAQEFTNPNYYNQSIVLEFSQNISTEKLAVIFRELIKHHDALRINYNRQKGKLFYNNKHLTRSFTIPEYDLSTSSPAAQIAKMNFLAERIQSGFDIETSLLLRACIFNLDQNKKLLMLTAHHLVVDGVSWRIILNDLNEVARQFDTGQDIQLPAKTSSYQKWAETLKAEALKYVRKDIHDEKKYWQSVVNKEFIFQYDFDLGPDFIADSETIMIQLEEEATALLLSKANTPYNTTTYDLLITSLMRTIKKHTKNGSIVVELESHGRHDSLTEVDISRTVGWFTCLYPFYIELKGEEISCHIKEVKEQLKKVTNEAITFGILKYLVKDNDLATEKRGLRFNYLGDFTRHLSDDGPFVLLTEQVGKNYDRKNSLTCLLDINCFISGGKLTGMLTYSKRKFKSETIESFAASFVSHIREVLGHCLKQDKIEFTPSDFDMVSISPAELKNLFG